ncbi:hypothetical protein VAE130_600147 [Vibrio aestuarianus]|nr:hypothetical protein VAE130_600147 [Vibrio aestuarianus]
MLITCSHSSHTQISLEFTPVIYKVFTNEISIGWIVFIKK